MWSRPHVLVADPPWRYGDEGSRIAPASGHYQTQSVAEICAAWPEERATIAAPSILFLWATNSFVVGGEALEVCSAWGYQPRQLIPWVKVGSSGKPQIGMGHYTRCCTEQLILATRGSMATSLIRSFSVPGVIIAPRGRHSAKPDASYQMIEALTAGPYVELYARRRWSEAWECYGDQVEG